MRGYVAILDELLRSKRICKACKEEIKALDEREKKEIRRLLGVKE